MNTASASPLAPAFADPVLETQAVFRCLLSAFASPGSRHDLPIALAAPNGLNMAAYAALLCLVDHQTPVWLDRDSDHAQSRDALRFHTGCRFTTDRADARFALLTAGPGMAELRHFAQGSPAFPDRSATVILMVAGFEADVEVWLSGPGLAAPRALAVSPCDRAFWQAVDANHQSFPCGVDLVFTCCASLVALPRSTRIDWDVPCT